MDKIYLIGLPGSGKTETGKWLAAKLGWDFSDLDQIVENEAGMQIPEIFSTQGEPQFRQLEREALISTFERSYCVISCGGGTAAWFDNMDLMSRNGLTIYLNTGLDVIARRLEKSGPRPVLEGEPGQSIMSKLESMAEKRRPYYSRAKVVWNKPEPEEHFYRSVNTLLTFYSA